MVKEKQVINCFNPVAHPPHEPLWLQQSNAQHFKLQWEKMGTMSFMSCKDGLDMMTLLVGLTPMQFEKVSSI